MWATWGSALGWQVEGIYETGHYALHSRTSALASREQHLLLAWQDKVRTLLAFLVQKVRTLLAFPSREQHLLVAWQDKVLTLLAFPSTKGAHFACFS